MSKNNSTKPDFLSSSVEAQAGADPGSVQSQLIALRSYIDLMIQTHIHSGVQARRIELQTDIGGLFQTVASVPTNKPQTIYDQVQIYVSGSTYRLYWYDTVGQTWHYSVGV